MQETNKKIKLKSYSKINLCLWIKEKRSDGYHEIETIYLENENLFDDIEVELIEDNQRAINVSMFSNEFECSISLEDNLVYKAAYLFFEKIGFKGSCNIRINKKIPILAGLGGGSSNAGYVLKSLNQMFDYQLHESELLLLALQLGSDVPFFIMGQTCLAKGRGEKLQKIENKLNLNIKIVKLKNISVSTKWAYEEIDSIGQKPDHTIKMKNLINALQFGDYEELFSNIFNDFEKVVFSKYPILLKEKNELLNAGYAASGLCGSGSAIFGIKKAS